MRELLRVTLFLVAIFLSATPGFATEKEKVKALLSQVGVDAVAARLGQTLLDSLESQPGPTADFQDQVRILVARHFDGDAIFADLVDNMSAALSDDEVDALSTLYEQDIARRATALEVASETDTEKSPEETQAEGARLLAEARAAGAPRPDQCKEALESLDAVDNATAVTLNVSYAMISAMIGGGAQPGVSMSEAEILALVKQQEPAIRAGAETALMNDCAYTYRSFSDADMAAYVAFLDQPPVRKLYSAMNQAFDASLTARARAFGRDMMAGMKAKKI